MPSKIDIMEADAIAVRTSGNLFYFPCVTRFESLTQDVQFTMPICNDISLPMAAFQAVCARVGVTQAWTLLQGQLGVPATGKNDTRTVSHPSNVVQGALNQATFQALLANTHQAALAQQLLTLGGVSLTFPGK